MPSSVTSLGTSGPARRGHLCSDEIAMVDLGEVRLDPEGGFAATLDELRDYYAGKRGPEEISKYWATKCLSLEEDEHHSRGDSSGETSKLAKALELSHYIATEERWGSACDGVAPRRSSQGSSRSPVTWEFQQDNGVWDPLLPADSALVERHYAADPHAEFIARMGPSSLQYNIRLYQRSQFNLVSGNTRALRRACLGNSRELVTGVTPLQNAVSRHEQLHTPHPAAASSTLSDPFEDDELARAIAASLTTGHEAKAARSRSSDELAEAVAASLGTAVSCTETVQRILKITFGDDTRRTRLSWPACTNAQDVIAAIHVAVMEVYDTVALNSTEPILQYMDEDGDVCSLVAATLQDFLTFAQGDVLRIHVKSGELQVEEKPNNSILAAPSLEAVAHVESTVGRESLDISIATPPCTPRRNINEEYEFEWSIVEAPGGSDEDLVCEEIAQSASACDV